MPFSSCEKWKGVPESLAWDGSGVTMDDGLPFLADRLDSGHGLCPSDLEKWRRVVIVITHPSSIREGRRMIK